MSPLSSSGHIVQSFFTYGPPYAVVFFFAGLARLKVARFAMTAPTTPLTRLISPQVQFRIHVAQS